MRTVASLPAILILCLAPLLLLAQESSERTQSPDARALVTRAIELDRYGLKPPRDYTFKRRDQTDKIDSDGNILDSEARTFEVISVYGEPVEHLIALNDQPLSEREGARELAHYKREIERLQRRSSADRERRDAEASARLSKDKAFLHEIPDVYDLKVAGEEPVHGRTAWVVEARPRPNAKIHTSGREANLLRLAGRIWIDKEDGQWVRVEASPPKDLAFGGVLARIHSGSQVLFEQTRVEPGVWLPSHTEGRLSARVLGMRLEIRNESTFFDYQRFHSTATILAIQEP